MLLLWKCRFSCCLCVSHIIYCVFVQMHIVSKRKDLTLKQALQTPDGLAVLGFFIQVAFSASHYLCRK